MPYHHYNREDDRHRIPPARSTSGSTAITQDTTFSGSTAAFSATSPTGTSLLPRLLDFNEVDEMAACEDVRRMAEALAPQVMELEDAIRQNASSFDYSNDGQRSTSSQDDDMDDEMHNLALSEQALREELELAQEFSNWMVTPRGDEQLNISYNQTPSAPATPAAVATRDRANSSMSMEENFSNDDDGAQESPNQQNSEAIDEPLSYDKFASQVPEENTSEVAAGNTMESFETPGSITELLSSSAISMPSLELDPPSFLRETSVDSALGTDTSADRSDVKDESIDEARESSLLSSSTVSSEAQSAPASATHRRRRRKPRTITDSGSLAVSSVSTPKAYTLEDHAHHLRLCTEKTGGWYYSDMTRFLCPEDNVVDRNDEEESYYTDEDGSDDDGGGRISESNIPKSSFVPPPPKPNPYSRLLVKDYCLPIPIRKLKRLYTGLVHHEFSQTPSRTPPLSSTPTRTRTSSTDGLATIRSPQKQSTGSLSDNGANAPQNNGVKLQDEPLPVRTLSIHIRPDVLCGAVMDAVHHAMEVDTAHILKRQGGHLRGAVVNGGYVVDAQLCTHKLHTEALERRLLLRFYHISDDPDAFHDVGGVAVLGDPDESMDGTQPPQDDQPSAMANRHLKQSCSLIQRLMAQHVSKRQANKNGTPLPAAHTWLGLTDMAFSSRELMQQAIGTHLESNYKACPSVREENKKVAAPIAMRRLTLPSLSRKDWSILQASWTLVSAIWEELDTRDLTHNTLSTQPFGYFPCLPTLDVHFCSQLRRLSRDAMITQLLKSAKELEDYAKSAEYNCANMVMLLGPMVEYYRVPPIDLPKPKALEDYPLDYTPPQISCPPWGNKVMEAMNQVAARTTRAAAQSIKAEETGKEPEDDGKPTGISASDAVRRVYAAFVKQDDEEQSARLGRKNAQVMERLSNMQSHQRAIIHSIRDAHVHSRVALEAADAFLIKAQQSCNMGHPGFPHAVRAQVPLLSFRISVGGSISGTCYITANQMLFSTTYIPLVGGTKNTLFDLDSVSFRVEETVASTLLNPFPNTMFVLLADRNTDQRRRQQQSSYTSDEKVLFSFRPSIGPARLHKFLKVIQTFQAETSAPTEFSQPDKVVIEEDGVLRLANTVSEDQLSI